MAVSLALVCAAGRGVCSCCCCCCRLVLIVEGSRSGSSSSSPSISCSSFIVKLACITVKASTEVSVEKPCFGFKARVTAVDGIRNRIGIWMKR